MAADTPWGKAQTTEAITDGMIAYTTAGHGGIKLSEERFERMPEPYKSVAPFAGRLWYEEDADWALVALAFPDDYCAGMEEEYRRRVLKSAKQTFDQYHAPKLARETPE
jgi:hypothetical protein